MHLCARVCAGYNLGETMRQEVVNDVRLPPWASSPEDFVRKHMMALVSANTCVRLISMYTWHLCAFEVIHLTQWCLAVQLFLGLMACIVCCTYLLATTATYINVYSHVHTCSMLVTVLMVVSRMRLIFFAVFAVRVAIREQFNPRIFGQ